MTEQQADADRRFGPRATAVIREWTGAHPAEDRDPSVAEAELDAWMTRAYEAEGKLWKAEKRVEAVLDVLNEPDAMIGTRLHVTVDRIYRALESVPPPSA